MVQNSASIRPCQPSRVTPHGRDEIIAAVTSNTNPLFACPGIIAGQAAFEITRQRHRHPKMTLRCLRRFRYLRCPVRLRVQSLLRRFAIG